MRQVSVQPFGRVGHLVYDRHGGEVPIVCMHHLCSCDTFVPFLCVVVELH